MNCILCPSTAVADGLCVPCGAKLWAARLWATRPKTARMCAHDGAMTDADPERVKAIRAMYTMEHAKAFIRCLEAARAKLDAKNAKITKLDKERG